ncbi:MAG: calcium-binding protein [Paracoccaceae bacterium]|nr:calcium-binding protein [Paracoccaceae bacterium]
MWTYSVVSGEIRDYSSQTPPISGTENSEGLVGSSGADHILGHAGNDTLSAGGGSDTIDAGDGDDFVFGGLGNDQIYGRAGDDNILGGSGADQISGDSGNDILTGSSRSDIILGGSGDDFLNGGFGFDHLTGGSGADRFYHEGVADHGSDWITDYYAAEGDVLCMGKPSASAADFIVQFAETVGAGQSGVKEAFVTYIPTRQILWAIEDGELADQILIQLSGATFDLI